MWNSRWREGCRRLRNEELARYSPMGLWRAFGAGGMRWRKQRLAGSGKPAGTRPRRLPPDYSVTDNRGWLARCSGDNAVDRYGEYVIGQRFKTDIDTALNSGEGAEVRFVVVKELDPSLWSSTIELLSQCDGTTDLMTSGSYVSTSTTTAVMDDGPPLGEQSQWIGLSTFFDEPPGYGKDWTHSEYSVMVRSGDYVFLVTSSNRDYVQEYAEKALDGA